MVLGRRIQDVEKAMTVLGIAPGLATAPAGTPRINTRSAYDLSYWASGFVTEGTPSDYLDAGTETDAASLISWAASQIGVDAPTEYAVLYPLLSNDMTVSKALRTRGVILVCQQRVSISMGLGDVIDLIDGRYFQYKPAPAPQTPSLCLYTWDYGSFLPGVVY